MNWLDEILRDFPDLPEKAKERLKYWQERYTVFEKENESLRHENDRLKRETTEMQKQIQGQLDSAGFVESEGVLWKKKPNGGYEKSPYCPICKVVMTPSPPMLPVYISCIKCSFNTPFRPDDVPKILKELPK